MCVFIKTTYIPYRMFIAHIDRIQIHNYCHSFNSHYFSPWEAVLILYECIPVLRSLWSYIMEPLDKDAARFKITCSNVLTVIDGHCCNLFYYLTEYKIVQSVYLHYRYRSSTVSIERKHKIVIHVIKIQKYILTYWDIFIKRLSTFFVQQANLTVLEEC